ncbi:mercuric ion reductase [Dehalogenimonas sp. WBC-2]|nr:mercuric ion reductase [Dehalogenimonas sp. WBC-2]
MPKYNYDVIVIGGGVAGFAAAGMATGIGKRVLLIEKDRLGGSCNLHTCMPTKALIRAGIVRDTLVSTEKFGLGFSPGHIGTDKVFRYVTRVIDDVSKLDTVESFQEMGIDIKFGSPEFLDNHRVRLDGHSISGGKFIIATGGRPAEIEINGYRDAPYLNNQTVFNLDKMPASIIIIGGGPAGLEFASAFNLLGLEVTVVELADTILTREDGELVTMLSGHLTERGIKILTGHKSLKLKKAGAMTQLEVQNKAGASSILEAEAVLLTIGRQPNIEGLNLDKAGVKYTGKGITVNQRQKTSADNIYACGDVTGIYQMAATSEYQALVAANNAVIPLLKQKADYKHLIWVTFTEPPLAHAGLTEEEARAKYGNNIRIYRYDYKSIRRAKMEQNDFGLAKFICTKNFKLVGIQILGDRAEELAHEAQVVKVFGKPIHRLHFVPHAYPTYAEGIIKRIGDMAYLDWMSSNPFIRLGLKIMPGFRNNMAAVKSKL